MPPCPTRKPRSGAVRTPRPYRHLEIRNPNTEARKNSEARISKHRRVNAPYHKPLSGCRDRNRLPDLKTLRVQARIRRQERRGPNAVIARNRVRGLASFHCMGAAAGAWLLARRGCSLFGSRDNTVSHNENWCFSKLPSGTTSSVCGLNGILRSDTNRSRLSTLTLFACQGRRCDEPAGRLGIQRFHLPAELLVLLLQAVQFANRLLINRRDRLRAHQFLFATGDALPRVIRRV